MSVSMLMASPLAKGLFQRAIGESGGLFEPLQLAPKYLLANAEHDGEKYAASLKNACPFSYVLIHKIFGRRSSPIAPPKNSD
jgi:carboxylesterase type B